ncbi:class I SAM-dependent methyltransferase [Algisphaera agarilytica]|uniref:SAM-dependent methyltransferase n=1 Tax=Algisphaera agarilytica TaxID=1385975 RepID=A0A7X0H728_9BACT|nr:class I SAM-dependent methyltransferase [Algisphaera agarilytica]MBB6428995.1 SAM-dependent methyltransferase [Algisphaera agarilytica]
MSVPISYWSRQSPKFGLRDLLNDKVYIDPSSELTDPRWGTTLSLIREELRGDESKALDFYCGAGRFTQDLAQLVDGDVLGVDTSLPLIHEATPSSGVRFIHIPDGRVPTPPRSMDLVLANHALGGLRGRLLDRAVGEIVRVLKSDGLLVLIENTADLPDTRQHVYRDVETYREMFPQMQWKRDAVHLENKSEGVEDAHRMSVLMGRMMGDDAG